MGLQDIWFFLWGLLWAIYFITDGFDFGLGIMLPFIAKDEAEKRTIYTSMGPLWDGNEVWLITAGGVTFAAFPKVYAVMFSSLYSPLMLILFGLIIRGVAYEFREKSSDPSWKKLWDTCMFLGSFFPAFLLGVAFANIFKGIPIDGKGYFHGTILTFINPYGLLGGILFVLMFMLHGCMWLLIKSKNELYHRAKKTAKKLWFVLLIVIIVFLDYTYIGTKLFDNYIKYPILSLVLIITIVCYFILRFYINKDRPWICWFLSAITIISIVFFGVIGLYPNMFPSSISPAYSLTAYNASSTPLTLKIMLTVVIIFVPIVLAYQIWAYNMFKEKIKKEDLYESYY